MRLIFFAPLVVLVALGLFQQTESTGILGLLGPALAGGIGILGPLKIAIMSKAGFALGIVGTALGGTALGVAIKSKYDYDDGGYYSYGGGYEHGGWRKKRDLEGQVDVEDAFEYVQKSDPTHCTERMICDLARKAYKSPKQLSSDEYSILSLVGGKSEYNSKKIGKAHSSFEVAMKYGFSNADCSSVYYSCPFNGEELMNLVRVLGSQVSSESTENIVRFIKS